MNKNRDKDYEYLNAVYKAADDKLATEIIAIDISELSTMADYFFIATGSNPNQVRAIAGACEEELHKLGLKLQHSEGYNSLNWVLLDFGNIIVHIFDKEQRQFYDLERVWGDAKKLDLESINK